MTLRRTLSVIRESLRLDRARPRVRRTRDESAFLPAAIEVLETPPNPVGHLLLWSVIGFVLLALAWSWFGHVDIVAVAQGRLIPSGRLQMIQAAEIGVVRRIHVAEGARVRAGDPLLELDGTMTGADRDRLAREVLAMALDRARLEAMLADLADPLPHFAPPAEAPPELVDAQRRLLLSEAARHRAQLAALGEEEKRRQAQAAASRSQIERIRTTLPLIAANAKALATLAGQGHASRLRANEVLERQLGAEQDILTEGQRLAEAEAGALAVREQRRQAEQELRAQALKELAAAREKGAAAEQELLKAVQRTVLQVLRAPVDGTVHQLAVHTIGGVVQPAEILMAIVPADARLEVEATLPNKDVGFVRPGQTVAIKLDAFPYTVYGMLQGTVTSISADAVVAPAAAGGGAGRQGQRPAAGEAGQPQGPVYVARVALAQSAIAVQGNMVDLVAGMAVTVEIRTGHRRVLQFLLDPIVRYRHEAARER